MTSDRHLSWPLQRWQVASLVVLEGLFAACATSVLVYRALDLAPRVIHFGWDSYRAFNIYVSIGLVACFVIGLLRGVRHTAPLLAAFAFFHLVDGLMIGFWTKATLQFAALGVLAWPFLRARVQR